jgi:tripartite-type tricarboxylate transporter receptor subunit TctC
MLQMPIAREMTMKRTLAALLGLALCALLIKPASADYPDKVVRIIVPVAAT